MNPIPVLFLAMGTLVFTSILYGNALADESFPNATVVNFGQCGNEGGFGALFCPLWNVFLYIVNIFKIIFGAIAFVFNLVTLNVPGAPWYIRAMYFTFFGGTITWSIASLLRGGS